MQQERNRSLHHASHVPSNSSPICCRSLHPLTHMAQQAFGSSQATVRPHASQPPSGTASAGVLPLLLALPSAAVIVNRSSNKSTARQRRQGRGCRKSVSRGSGRQHKPPAPAGLRRRRRQRPAQRLAPCCLRAPDSTSGLGGSGRGWRGTWGRARAPTASASRRHTSRCARPLRRAMAARINAAGAARATAAALGRSADAACFCRWLAPRSAAICRSVLPECTAGRRGACKFKRGQQPAAATRAAPRERRR